jgi:uncharacterized phage protein gp47/JayE
MSGVLPTYACTINPNGITSPSYNDILQSRIAQMQSIFGSDISLNPGDQDFQMLAIWALAQFDSNQATIAAYNSFMPTFAQGVSLSVLVKINGLMRLVASASTAVLTVTGVVGTNIVNGVAQDVNGNLWSLPVLVIIPLSGSINVSASCQTLGSIGASSNTINQIFNPQLGWQSVNNTSGALQGAPVETDAALRQRQTISVSLPALTPLQSISAAIAQITGVTESIVYENPTNATDSNGLPPHSISAVVAGGASTDIATVIERTKSLGTGTFGSTSVIVIDPAGLPITINYYVLVQVNIFVSLTIKALTGYVSSTSMAIQSAIADFINSLTIGQAVRINWVNAAAQMISNPILGETFEVTALTQGFSATPVGVIDLAIPFNQEAISLVANIVITVT